MAIKKRTSIFGSVKNVANTTAETLEDVGYGFKKGIKAINNELDQIIRTNLLDNELEYQDDLALYEDTIIENIEAVQAKMLTTDDEIVKRVLGRRLARLESLIK